MYDFKKIINFVIIGFLAISTVILAGTTIKYYSKYTTSKTEIGRIEEELTRSREAVDEYESRLRNSIEVITRARGSSGRTEDLLRDSIEIIDELTTILFPDEQTERNLENRGDCRYKYISASDLYNYNIIVEEVEE